MYFKSRKSIGSWLGAAEAKHGGDSGVGNVLRNMPLAAKVTSG